MFLLDTNVVSDLRRPLAANAGLRAWASAASADDMYLSVVTIFELERGILLKLRRDPASARPLRNWFDICVLARFAGRILPVDIAVAHKCAELHAPVTRPEADALIAATALVHGMTIVTLNVRDFEGTGVKVMCPLDSGVA